MSRTRFLAISAILLMTMAAAAQQPGAARNRADQDQPAHHPSANDPEEHLRMLTERLSLTSDQQEKIRPLIQNMLEERHKIMRDQTLSSDQRREKLRGVHENADQELRKILNDDQKKKLDEMEAQHKGGPQAHPHQ